MKHQPVKTQRPAPSSAAAKAAALSAAAAELTARERIAMAMHMTDRLALVSSFGADSVALIELVASLDRDAPVLFVDTEMLFPETLDYQARIAETLGLTDIRVIRPSGIEVNAFDRVGDLHRSDPDRCCHLRKTRPLRRALLAFDGWISGRKRHQNDIRGGLPFVETDEAGRLKFNPLADWSAEKVRAHIAAKNLPPHPLVAQGYPSIGCAPCTTKVRPGEDPRAGRWRGAAKTECGIHFVDGKMVRSA